MILKWIRAYYISSSIGRPIQYKQSLGFDDLDLDFIIK